jgi:hypothetical protein
LRFDKLTVPSEVEGILSPAFGGVEVSKSEGSGSLVVKKVFMMGLTFLALMLTFTIQASVDYTLWEEILKEYVNEHGEVDYAHLKNERAKLDQFLMGMAATDISNFNRPEKMAFWINAYNALTVQTILEHYPVESIKKIPKVWDTPKPVAQSHHTLNDIEHNILRPLGDPRIHFALNCASRGCPQLPQEPFEPQTLDDQLNREAIKFINNPEKVRFDEKRNALYVSPIFKWFKEDFLSVAVSISDFIKGYLQSADKQLQNENLPLKYLDYDWGLNDQNKSSTVKR